MARESLRLGLIACLQHLPARQQAVLILRDVLAFPAAEVTAMLGTSIVAVKSSLQRARALSPRQAPPVSLRLLRSERTFPDGSAELVYAVEKRGSTEDPAVLRRP